MFDILISNGTLIDGTGSVGRGADVAVVGDRIAAVGALANAAARRTIDAGGHVVAPGFVDVHNHSDGWLLKRSNFLPKTHQGFTTEILASDGISYAPVTVHNWRDWIVYLRSLNALEPDDYDGWLSIDDYLTRLDGRSAQNAAMLIPYANLRVLAAGWRRGPLDDMQKRIIRREVERGMEAGAVGLSTGLDYVAQCFSTTDELVDACRAMAPWNAPYVTHVRYKLGTLAGVQEAVEIGRRAGVPVHISHLKAGTPEDTDRILSYIDRAAGEVDLTFDIYPYLPGSTMLNYLLPYEVWEYGPLAVAEKLRDPAVRQRVALAMECFDLPMERVRLAWLVGDDKQQYLGWSLAKYAAHAGKSVTDALCDLLIESNLAGLSVLENGDDRLVGPFLAHPKCMLGSDGIYFPDGRVHARVTGSAARMLGPCVRDWKLFSLETAVHKMSGYPAARFGLADRGVAKEGAYADLVVFDPATVQDCASYEQPHELSTGVAHVVVNGVEIVRGANPSADVAKPPGRALRFRSKTKIN
jgi:N-acyl-D-amino-acid deacylase